MNYLVINSDGKFLTNHGGTKYWFTDSIEIPYRFDDKEAAQRFANHYGGTVVTEDRSILITNL